MKRILVVLLVFLFLTNTLVIGQQRSRASAKRKGLETLCDQVAAHPNDPMARSKGIIDANLDATAVITHCEAEVAAGPVSPLSFQLARGYLKAGRVEDAIEQLIVAAKAGHGGALAYLGDFYLDGGAGLEADPVLAHSLYQRAAAAGFKPAKTVLAQFEDVTDSVDTYEATSGLNVNTKYINPEIVDNILKGDLDAVPFGELYTKAYLANIAENISETCEDHFTSREIQMLKLEAVEKSVEMTAEAGLTTLMGALMGFAQIVQNPGAFIRQQAEVEIDQDQLPEDAMKDSFRLMKRYGCGSRELGQFSRNLVSYIRNEGAPRMSTEEMYSRCQREARPTGRYDAKNFCMCFVSAMSQTGVSRANRKGLSSDFWGTAQKMMAQKPQHYSMCTR